MLKPATMKARRLVLGYDGGCAKCSGLAQRISEQTGDKLEVLSLHHPQVEHWRQQILGKEAARVPTLFEVDNAGRIRAWTGSRMAVRLARALGPVVTWRVMLALGGVGVPTATEVGASAGTVTSGLSRTEFIKAMGGLALGLGLLSGSYSPALAVEDELDEEALFQAFSIIEEIPDSVAARGNEAARAWLRAKIYAGGPGESLQPRGIFGCARAIIVAVLSNAIPVLKIRKAIKVFGGARKLAAFMRRTYLRFRRLGNSVGTSIKKTAKAVANRVLAVSGQDIFGALLALFSLDGVRRECF